MSERSKTNNKRLSPTEYPRAIETLEGTYLDGIQLKKILSQIGNPKYRIITKESSTGHRYGDGGEWEDQVVLVKGSRRILVSRSYRSYMTYSDDSTDYEFPREEATFLLAEDPVGRALLEHITKQSGVKDAAPHPR